MPVALRRVFPKTIHRLCLWHMQDRYMTHLNELYTRFKKRNFKEKFQSVLHHPLTPIEFERAWSMMLDEFEINENPTLQAMYDLRSDWVPSFFKKDYCGVMLSTQRSESMNNIVKSCHVDANTPLHRFAKQMVKFLHRRRMAEAAEKYGEQVRSDLLNLCSVVLEYTQFQHMDVYTTVLN